MALYKNERARKRQRNVTDTILQRRERRERATVRFTIYNQKTSACVRAYAQYAVSHTRRARGDDVPDALSLITRVASVDVARGHPARSQRSGRLGAETFVYVVRCGRGRCYLAPRLTHFSDAAAPAAGRHSLYPYERTVNKYCEVPSNIAPTVTSFVRNFRTLYDSIIPRFSTAIFAVDRRSGVDVLKIYEREPIGPEIAPPRPDGDSERGNNSGENVVMAIAFNLPSEREANEENFSRLNRLLGELYEVLCHILVSRQPDPEGRERRDRPFSDSDIETATRTNALDFAAQPPLPLPRRRPMSASIPPILNLNLDYNDLDDDVFVSPRTDNGNDPFSNPRNMEIFGSPRNGSPRTPAGVLLSPRRERKFTFSGTSEKHWRDKGGTIDETDGIFRSFMRNDADEIDNSTRATPANSESTSTSNDGSIFSSLAIDKLSGSICTAVLFMLGWKLLYSKR